MKNFLILSFFALFITLSVFAMKAGAMFRLEGTEVNYRTLTHTISDTEVENYNKQKYFTSPLEIREGFKNIRYDEIKETRTRTLTGWETKVDTVKTYVKLEACGC